MILQADEWGTGEGRCANNNFVSRIRPMTMMMTPRGFRTTIVLRDGVETSGPLRGFLFFRKNIINVKCIIARSGIVNNNHRKLMNIQHIGKKVKSGRIRTLCIPLFITDIRTFTSLRFM